MQGQEQKRRDAWKKTNKQEEKSAIQFCVSVEKAKQRIYL